MLWQPILLYISSHSSILMSENNALHCAMSACSLKWASPFIGAIGFHAVPHLETLGKAAIEKLRDGVLSQALSGAIGSMTQQIGGSPMPSPARPVPSGPRQPLKPLVHSRAVLQDTMREVKPLTARNCSTCSPK